MIYNFVIYFNYYFFITYIKQDYKPFIIRES